MVTLFKKSILFGIVLKDFFYIYFISKIVYTYGV